MRPSPVLATEPAPEHHGLARDFPLLRRRRMMGLVGGTTVATLAAAAMRDAARAGALAPMPPGWDDAAPRGGSLLTRSGIVRSDIRRSFGTANGVARGVPLTIRLRVVSANSGKPVAGHAVYLWHCDRDGAYSLHSPGLSRENYLRGVQASDDAGWVQFTSIFPGAYAGRWPHIHFEVYPGAEFFAQSGGAARATASVEKLHTSQLALPADVCEKVYATAGYGASRTHLSGASLATDSAFADGGALEMASVTGDVARGFVATRTVGI